MSNRSLLVPVALLAFGLAAPAAARPKAPGATPPSSRDQAYARHQALIENSLSRA
jgi:hypothetical protein